jgi:hypothetical protein
VLSVEHRAAAAPEAIMLALVGTDQDMHLAIVRADDALEASASPPPADLDATILHTLDRAGLTGLSRAALRAAVHVRNERVGDALTRLAAPGQITRRGETWIRVPLPPGEADRNGNGNGSGPDA